MKGVIRTRVGYSGGTKKNPTYYGLGDHSESIQIDYDPARISYEELLNVFWKSHHPTQHSWSTQYKSAVFYHNDEQKRLAEETRAREQARLQGKIVTDILPASEFYRAEDYHQKYRLRQNAELMKAFGEIYGNDSDFVDSTLAAKVNGYLAGYGTLEHVDAELNELDISPEKANKFRDLLMTRKTRAL
jgi:peptide-methionine (S)-S-oxide reductase